MTTEIFDSVLAARYHRARNQVVATGRTLGEYEYSESVSFPLMAVLLRFFRHRF